MTAAALDAAADTDKPHGHKAERGKLCPPQLFPKQKGREQQDQHRPHIVEQRGKTDVQQPVRLKQGDPVQTQRRPAEKEGDTLGAAVGAVKAAAQQDHGRQRRAADERAQQHDLTGRERKTRDKQAVRAENQHGQQIMPVVKQRGAVFRGGLFVVHFSPPVQDAARQLYQERRHRRETFFSFYSC